MKKISLLLVVCLIMVSQTYSQFVQPSKFEYSMLKDKVLMIPEYDVNSLYAKKLAKKGKFAEAKEEQEKIAEYNRIWKEGLATSSYDATAYEIRAFDQKQLIKEKNEKAIVLYFYVDDYGNYWASLFVTGPKRANIAIALINGMDLSTVEDVRLLMNLLNYSLLTASEVEGENEKVTYSGMRDKYKENMLAFFDKMTSMTFLVPEYGAEEKNAAKLNADLKEALKSWTISKYEVTTSEAIDKKRLEGDPNSFYWRNFNLYTNNILITYRINYLITTEKDEPIFYFMGTKELKGKTIEEAQEKMKSKAEKYKRQLENK